MQMKTRARKGGLRILGIDPGLAKLGYAVVDDGPDGIISVEFGLIRTKPGPALSVRLNDIAEKITEIIDEFHPDIMAVETVFFAKNAKTAMTIGRVTGAVMAIAGLRGLDVVEYTPLDIKRTVVGTGRADKKQMQEMIRTLYRLVEVPRPPDVADALAICLTHLSYGLKRELEEMAAKK
jgi:crossover junction endodeoxyribonuclease RuvC